MKKFNAYYYNQAGVYTSMTVEAINEDGAKKKVEKKEALFGCKVKSFAKVIAK